MNAKYATVGTRVRSNRDFASVPKGTEGVIDQDYGSGVMVAWELPGRPLPAGYKEYDGRPAIASGILRDGFAKDDELQYLDAVVPNPTRHLKDGEPCDHRGCRNHVTHPCDSCGRTAARGEYNPNAGLQVAYPRGRWTS